jgi:hypothetical protein
MLQLFVSSVNFRLLCRNVCKMVKFADIDRLLNKTYLEYILKNGLKWPWPSTHFIIRHKCLNCGVISSCFGKPNHIIKDMNNCLNVIWWLRNIPLFCHICNYLLYDHYPADECSACAV